MLEGRWPRGVTPSPRSGAEAESARLTAQEQPRGASHFRGQGKWLGGATPLSRPGRRRGGATRGAVAAWSHESLEELCHVEGQEGQR